MDPIIHETMLNEIIVKTARLEVHLEAQKDSLRKIEDSLDKLAVIKDEVKQHGVIIKGFTWFIGIVVSFFTAKYLGNF